MIYYKKGTVEYYVYLISLVELKEDGNIILIARKMVLENSEIFRRDRF